MYVHTHTHTHTHTHIKFEVSMAVFCVMEWQVRNNTMKERPVHNFEGNFYSYVDTELPDYTVPQHIRPQYKT